MNESKGTSISLIEVVNDFLLIAWNTGEESTLSLKALRDNCPCAGCSGEVDALGNIYIGPQRESRKENYILNRVDQVGHYAIKPVWQDGHDDGLFTYDLLRKIANYGAEE